MTPYEIVAADWLLRPREQPLEWFENVHKRKGFLFVTPAVYLMGRPVMKYAPNELILDPEHVFDFDQCDAWYIEALAGDIRQAWQFMPWELPWMCFGRVRTGQRLHFGETRRMLRAFGVGLTG